VRKWYVIIDKKNFSLGSLFSLLSLALMAAAISEMKILSTQKSTFFFFTSMTVAMHKDDQRKLWDVRAGYRRLKEVMGRGN
jgi:hypothetical protein